MRFAPLLILFACSSPEPASPGGIVSLLPSITEWIVELGAADRLVACTKFCKPGRDLPRVPWQGTSAAEAIVRSGATLVFKQKPLRADDPLHRLLENAHLKVIALPSETIEDARMAVMRIGTALGLEREATARLERFDEEMIQATRGAVGKRRPSVLMVYSRDRGPVANISAAGPGSFLDELIRQSGGRNVLADRAKPYLNVDAESVLRRAPEVIIDASPGDAADWAAFKTVPAVRDGRVHVLPGSLLIVPGPRLPEAVRRFVEMLRG